MAKTFKIAVNPTFKATVQIPRIGGEPLPVSFTFKTMDRVTLAKTFDSWKEQNLAMLKDAQDREESGEPMSLADWTEREMQVQAQQLKDIIVGWGFEDEFNDENIEALVATSVSVTDVIVEQYNEAYQRARSGN